MLMSDTTVPVADAMEEAAAVLDAETLAAIEAVPEGAPTPEAAVPAVPEQVELFPPAPFDFEEAYDELHRLDQRARMRKSAWEIAKSDASDAKKSYDSAIEDLHKKFVEIERARSEAMKPRLVMEPATEGGDAQMGEDLDETIDTEQDPEPDTAPTPETDAPHD